MKRLKDEKNGTEPGQTQPKLEPDTRLKFTLQAEAENRSLKLKFEVEIWIWRFGVGEVENDKATNKKDANKIWKTQTSEKIGTD